MGKTLQAEGGLEQKHQTVGGARDPPSLKERAESVELSTVSPAYHPQATVAALGSRVLQPCSRGRTTSGCASRYTCRVADQGSLGTATWPKRVLASSRH